MELLRDCPWMFSRKEFTSSNAVWTSGADRSAKSSCLEIVRSLEHPIQSMHVINEMNKKECVFMIMFVAGLLDDKFPKCCLVRVVGDDVWFPFKNTGCCINSTNRCREIVGAREPVFPVCIINKNFTAWRILHEAPDYIDVFFSLPCNGDG